MKQLKQTRLRALKYGAELWHIIAERGCSKTEAMRMMRGRHLELRSYAGVEWDCFSCQYDTTHDRDYCGVNCISAKVWGGGGCQSSKDSPFRFWVHADNPEDKHKYALQIAEGHDKLVKELEDKKAGK